MSHPIIDVVQCLEEGSVRTAHRLLDGLSYDLHSQTKEFIFADVLKKKIDPHYDEWQSVYFNEYNDMSHIDIFSTLRKIVPFTYLYQLSNSTTVELMINSNLPEVAYMDLGLGKADQSIAVMELLAQKENPPKKLTIIGLEPMQESLEVARQAIETASKRCPFEVDFVEINKAVENLTSLEWQHLQERFTGRIVINTAYSLHHIVSKPNENDRRDQVLRELCLLNPRAFILIEADSYYNIDDFFLRFQNCWEFCGAWFDMIDALSELTDAEKVAVKIFSWREIEDIVSKDAVENRHERSERLSLWAKRLIKAGFRLEKQILTLPLLNHPALTVEQHKDYVGIEFNNRTIVGIVIAKCE